jgi:hypothetical protein
MATKETVATHADRFGSDLRLRLLIVVVLRLDLTPEEAGRRLWRSLLFSVIVRWIERIECQMSADNVSG